MARTFAEDFHLFFFIDSLFELGRFFENKVVSPSTPKYSTLFLVPVEEYGL
jgi:hypothetical protein